MAVTATRSDHEKEDRSTDRQHAYGMGRIFRRGRIWWVRYYHNGQEFNESSHAEKESEAKKLLKQRFGEIALGRFAGPKAEKITLAELADDLKTDYRIRGRKNQRNLKSKVHHLLAYFGKGTDRAKSITTDRIKKYIDRRQEAGAADAQINRELAALKRMFSLAQETEKMLTAPYVPMLTENNVRIGFFEYGEFVAVRDALPSFVRPVVTFGYYTGWRIAEILNLQWRQVDLNAAEVRLDPGTTKSGEGRVIYLDGDLLEVMKAQREWVLSLQRERGKIIPWVFVNPETGEQIRYFRRRWLKACQQTGLAGRIFHDFRRTAVRNMIRSGVPEVVAMQITGHKTRSVFDRYNIVSEQDLREAARRVSALSTKDQDKTRTVTPLATHPAAASRS